MTAVLPIAPAQATIDLGRSKPGSAGAALIRPVAEVARRPERGWWGRGRLPRAADATLGLAAVVALSPLSLSGGHPGRALDVAIAIVWVCLLSTTRAYETSPVNYTAEDVRRVLRAGLGLCAASVLLAAAVGATAQPARIVTFSAVSSGAAVAWRWSVTRPRILRRYPSLGVRTVVAGHRHDVERLLESLSWGPSRINVVAQCVVGGSQAGRTNHQETELDGLPAFVARHRADAVIVAPCRHLDPTGLRRLGWELEADGTGLFVAAELGDISPRRTRLGHAGRLPLLHVRHVDLRGGRRGLKAVAEPVVAAVALLALAPALVLLAVLIRLDSPGPVLYRQTRIGRDGRPFTMLKLRTMVSDADRRRAALVETASASDVLFKLRDDPRITRLGRMLRRYSLDELPQLINVLRREMSLVGPRPPLPEEVQRYRPDTFRRLVVRPGLTGLWQVSGRSDLSWDESVRLDLRYVENWSLSLDLWILCRTLGAVLGHRGAY